MFDRIRYGHVIDFIDAHIGDHHWPTFNVADIAICVGVGLMAVDMFTSKRGKAPVRRAPEIPPAQSGEPIPEPYPWYPKAAESGDAPAPVPAAPPADAPEAAPVPPESTAPEANR